MRRRQILDAVPAVIAGLAGCAGSTDRDASTTTPTGASAEGATATAASTDTPAESATTTGEHDPVSVDDAAYSRWLPRPEPFAEVHHYGFSAVDLQAVAEREDALPPGIDQSPHVDGWRPVDVDWRAVSMSLYFRRSFVIRGDYDPGAVVDGVAAADAWDSEPTDSGYDILVKDDGSKAVGVGDAAIVVSSGVGGDDPVGSVEHVIATANGDRVRYVGSSDVMYDLISELRDGTIVQGRTMAEVQERNPEAAPSEGRFPGQVGFGKWGEYDEGSTDVRIVVAYADEAAADVADLEAYVDENDDQFGDWSGLQVSRTGRLVTVSGTVEASGQ